MHESGLIRRMIATARSEAERQGAALAGIEVRLGALAGGSPEHLREHFDLALAELGLADIALDIREAPEHPGGVEIVGLVLRR
ncbi:hydrogenase/urease maturation nickel metallochaperone HypA [Nannocystaceae bacterium ST9]